MTAGIQLRSLGLKWSPWPYEPATAERLERILLSWEGTPYRVGSCQKGVGVYCTAFVAAVLDELYRRPPTPLPDLPNDIAFHNREGAIAGLRYFLRRYPVCWRIENGQPVEPGDILITGPQGGGPGHAMIVGTRPNTAWHATDAGVHFTGLAAPVQYRFHGAYRFVDRADWRPTED